MTTELAFLQKGQEFFSISEIFNNICAFFWAALSVAPALR
jgi:hypothetical protein